MAIATKRKPHSKPKGASKSMVPKQRAGKRTRATADDIEAPERSAPPLAEVDAEALEFIEAIDRFKKQHGRPFPSWSEVLLVLRQLGYRRV